MFKIEIEIDIHVKCRKTSKRLFSTKNYQLRVSRPHNVTIVTVIYLEQGLLTCGKFPPRGKFQGFRGKFSSFRLTHLKCAFSYTTPIISELGRISSSSRGPTKRSCAANCVIFCFYYNYISSGISRNNSKDF